MSVGKRYTGRRVRTANRTWGGRSTCIALSLSLSLSSWSPASSLELLDEPFELLGESGGNMSTSESESLSLGELPRGETGAKDGLRGTIRGCRLRRVFGVWGGHC
jgi:hypothetical protein